MKASQVRAVARAVRVASVGVSIAAGLSLARSARVDGESPSERWTEVVGTLAELGCEPVARAACHDVARIACAAEDGLAQYTCLAARGCELLQLAGCR